MSGLCGGRQPGEGTRTVYGNQPDRNIQYCDNKISNTKYTLITFLPYNLASQFSRFMNLYFLMIACLQLWPLITPVAPITTWGPLAFIFLLSAVKEAFDDYYRWQSDKRANLTQFQVVQNGKLAYKAAQDIRVGDILYLKDNSEIPCDLVVLKSSEEGGGAYTQTANLDGETDLKSRQCLKCTQELTEDEIMNLKCTVECATPNAEIYVFNSRLRVGAQGDKWESLSEKQTLLQATHLRNTGWIYGVTVYTGNETKVGMNKRQPPTKWTRTDDFINYITIFIFTVQTCITILMGVAGNLWKEQNGYPADYLRYPTVEPFLNIAIIPLRFLLLMSLMIPISLKVTLDITKYIYALFINWDLQMYDEETDTPAVASNTAIAEDLGQIEYVFSDKTGTLTENIMRFRKCSINDRLYGHGHGVVDALSDADLREDVRENPAVLDFFRALALCHTVIPVSDNDDDDDEEDEEDSEDDEPGKAKSSFASHNISYKASSPDEEALVLAAAEMNVVFAERDRTFMMCKVFENQEHYELLETLEFTSDRKRMSVLVRNQDTQEIFIYIKGADDKILKRLAEDQEPSATQEHLEMLAGMGLRTLLVGVRRVDDDEYEKWKVDMQNAKTAMKDREDKVAAAYEIMERDFTLLGATAIEDRLQESVPEVIHLLRQAGVTFWMLTGDKFSTAVQIATACNLMSPEGGKGGSDGKLLPVKGKSIEEVGQSINKQKKLALSIHNEKNVTVIIQGDTLRSALADHSADFLELCLLSKAVICCRVTPQQKADVVAMVKETGRRCLSIGDGGNDVSMIQEAHVGVGISGREGLQAARAADYSIAKFKYLQRLMLIHGRYAYLRTSFIAQYSFYKSAFVGLIQVTYGLYSGLSGASFFNSFMVMAYNTFFTGLPVFFYALDKDVEESSMEAYPHLYLDGVKERYLNVNTIAWWLVRAVFQAMTVFFIMMGTYNQTWLHPNDGREMDYLSISTPAYTAVIIVQTITMAYESHNLTFYNHFFIWGSLILYYLLMTVYNLLPGFDYVDVFNRFTVEPSFWLSTILAGVAATVPVICQKYFQYNYNPTLSQTVSQLEHQFRVTHGKNVPVELPHFSTYLSKPKSKNARNRLSMRL